MKLLAGLELMGRNEYARHRGDTPNAVSKAEKSRRIAAAVVRNVDGGFVGIDWRKADELWAANTDGDQAARNGKAGGAPAAAAGQLPLEQGQQDPGGEQKGNAAAVADKDPHGLLAARAETAKYQALQAEIEYLKTIGAVVSTEEMKTVGARRYRALRDRLRAVPDRIAAEIAAERDQARVHAKLAGEIDRVLYELSEDARAEVARGADERLAA